jgi:hypothetical protein
MNSLVDRLRGNYSVPVNDGAGLLDGKDTFERKFEVAPIQNEAANEIERLQSLLADVRKVAELNNKAMNAVVKRHRMAIAELTGDQPPNFEHSPLDALSTIHLVGVAQAEFDRIKLAE